MLLSRPFVFLISFLIFWVGEPLCAQTSQLHFQQFTTDDGLPSSETYVVFEDRDGYIWIGTDNGVARYDGYEFETFDSNDGLEDVVVFTILQDSKGRIWVGTLSGKAYYFEHGKFHLYRHNDAILATRNRNEFIHLIDVQEDGEVVFRLLNSGLFIVSQGGDIRPIRGESPEDLFYYVPDCEGEGSRKLAPIKRGYPKAVIDASFRVPEKVAYKIILGNDSCYREVAKIELCVSTQSTWPLKFISVVPEGDKEKVYFFNAQGVFSLSLAEGQMLFDLSSEVVNYVLPVSSDKLWVGFNGGAGLKIINLDSSSMKLEETHLAGRSITYITPDRRGGIWLSTTNAGVFYCSSPNQRKHSINPVAKALAIAATGKSSFYVSYSDASLYQVDVAQREFVDMDLKGRGYINWSEHLLYDEPSKRVFTTFFSMNHLPISERNTNANYVLYYGRDARLSITGIRRMTFSPFLGERKGLVANVPSFGIFDLDSLTTDFAHYDENLSVSVFYVDKDGRYLLGTLNGLMEFDPSHPDSIIRRIDFGVQELNARIVVIEEYEGGLLFGTRGEGLVYLKDGVAQVIKEKNGLASNMVRDVDISDAGDVWVASLNGLSKITFVNDEPSVRTFRGEHGLISNEIHDLDVYKNSVWIATSAGIQKFIEPPLVTYSQEPDLRRFVVDGNIVTTPEDLRVGAGNHNVSILFNTINFALGDQLKYRYRLENNAPWEYTDQRIVNFPRLGAGDYSFSVASQNEDQIWSEELKVHFTIAEYWYKTWPALLGGLLLFAASISFYFIWRERKRRWEQDLLLQINQLEHEAMHAQMNPHFVFNALNSIQNFVVHNDAKQAATYLSRFALVVRQTLNSSVKGQQTLAQEISMLETYLSLEKLRFKEAFQYEITLAPDLSVEDIILPPLLIQPFVENAILHGLKEVDEGGMIKISFSGNIKLLKVEIEDNGTGFEVDQQSGEDSMGMAITRRRLAMMEGKRNEASKMEVEPIYNDEGDLQGTKVILWIYLEKFLSNKDPLNPEKN